MPAMEAGRRTSTMVAAVPSSMAGRAERQAEARDGAGAAAALVRHRNTV